MVENMTLEELESELIRIPKTPENRARREILLKQVFKLLGEKVNAK